MKWLVPLIIVTILEMPAATNKMLRQILSAYGSMYAITESMIQDARISAWADIFIKAEESVKLQYPSPQCRLTWAVTHVIGMHVKFTMLGECDVASTTILGMLISNIVLTEDTRIH